MTLRISYFKLMLLNRVIFTYREQRIKVVGTEKHRRENVAMVGLLQYSSFMHGGTVTIVTLLSL